MSLPSHSFLDQLCHSFLILLLLPVSHVYVPWCQPPFGTHFSKSTLPASQAFTLIAYPLQVCLKKTPLLEFWLLFFATFMAFGSPIYLNSSNLWTMNQNMWFQSRSQMYFTSEQMCFPRYMINSMSVVTCTLKSNSFVLFKYM